MQIVNNNVSRVSASNVGGAADLITTGGEDAGTGLTKSSDASADVVSASTKAADIPVINPASHIDPALGIVVVETYGTDGVVENQYPTARMMREYTLYGLNAGT